MKKIAIDFLEDLLRIKSYDENGKKNCADLIKRTLLDLGFHVEINTDFGAPIIFASLDNGAKNDILFYSHYDVKPEGDLTEWNSLPFVPYYNHKEKKIYARGAGDDKGQIFATIRGIQEAIATGKQLKYNVTLLIEGNEENGSIGLEEFCNMQLKKKEYIAVIVTDSHWLQSSPVIYCGCRGQQTIKIVWSALNMTENLHAGNYGGLYDGAARLLINALIKIFIEIDKILESQTTQNDEFSNCAVLTYFSSGSEKRSTIPKNAIAKIDIRFIDDFFKENVKEILNKAKIEDGIEFEIEQSETGFYNVPDKSFLEDLQSIISETTLQKALVKNYCGAYLPLIKMKKINGKKYVVPFAQADEHNHVANENISTDHINYAIKIVKKILL